MFKQKFVLLSLGLLLCLLPSLSSGQDTSDFPSAVIDAMSTRDERYHHFLWHYIRDNWNQFDSDIQDEIRDRGWEPPRPARSYDDNGNSAAIIDNNSGEDFLYFHRQMINKVKDLLGDDSDALNQLTGWDSIPEPDDDDWPVPDEYEIRGSQSTTDAINDQKTDDFYNDHIKPLEDNFKDPDQLRDMTLGELGARVENTVHNWLHLRFSSESDYGYRPGGGGAFPYIGTKWDDSQYNWLGDTYSSQVNPVFWKIHGWVDARIEDWRKANDIDEIEWKGTWQGGSMDDIADLIDPSDQSDNNGGLESLAGPGAELSPVDSSFADNVQVDLGTSGKAPSAVTATQAIGTKKRNCRRFNRL